MYNMICVICMIYMIYMTTDTTALTLTKNHSPCLNTLTMPIAGPPPKQEHVGGGQDPTATSQGHFAL